MVNRVYPGREYQVVDVKPAGEERKEDDNAEEPQPFGVSSQGLVAETPSPAWDPDQVNETG
jgi:hypothetical protein